MNELANPAYAKLLKDLNFEDGTDQYWHEDEYGNARIVHEGSTNQLLAADDTSWTAPTIRHVIKWFIREHDIHGGLDPLVDEDKVYYVPKIVFPQIYPEFMDHKYCKANYVRLEDFNEAETNLLHDLLEVYYKVYSFKKDEPKLKDLLP